MGKATLIIASSLIAVCLTACSNDPAPAPSASAPAAAPAAAPDINYVAGAYDLEKGADGTEWRWIDQNCTIQLKNQNTDMRLKVVGNAPVDVLGNATKVTLVFNGEPLKEIALSVEKNEVNEEFTIPAAKLANGATSQLEIRSEKSFIPKNVDKKSADERKLAFSLKKVEWAAK